MLEVLDTCCVKRSALLRNVDRNLVALVLLASGFVWYVVRVGVLDLSGCHSRSSLTWFSGSVSVVFWP